MKTVKDVLLDEGTAIPGSLRILTGTTHAGKRAIYISGTSAGLRMLADLLIAQADAPDNEYSKLERDAGDLVFTTDDSVDVLELHNSDQQPEAHPPILK
jgi:hypothetical protein